MKTLHFQIHDLISFSVTGTDFRIKPFLKEFGYYLQENEGDTEEKISINIGKFMFKDKKHIIVNKKFQVTDEGIYCEDYYKVAKWKVYLIDLDKKHTKIYLDGNLFANLIWARWFCETIIRLKLILKGYCMFHSSCISNGRKGIVFTASPSTGKTTTLLEWLSQGNPFCSDEYTIFKDGQIMSYVTPFRFHSYNLSNNKEALGQVKTFDRLQIGMRSLLLKLTLGYGDITWSMALKDVFPNVQVLEKCALKGFYILTKTNHEKMAVKQLSEQAIIDKACILNAFEWFGFGPYLKAYAYVNPESDLASLDAIEKSNLKRELNYCEYHEIRIPDRFEKNNTDRLLDFL